MKKNFHIFITLIFLINISACTGYSPIYKSSDFGFKIAEYSILGEKKLGNQIYSQLNYISKTSKETANTKSISIVINVTKSKEPTAKDTAGKILGYRIYLSSLITVTDYLTEKIILNENFSYSSIYMVQSQFHETKKLEDRSIKNLVDKTYQDLLVKLSENI